MEDFFSKREGAVGSRSGISFRAGEYVGDEAGSRASQIGSPEATSLELPMAARMERQMPQAGTKKGGGRYT